MNRFILAIFSVFCLGLGQEVSPAKYSFNQAGSSVKFFNTASLHGIEGAAKSFSGSLDTDALTGGFSVKTASMTTNLGPRDTKMHEFCLESEKFPTIVFSVTGIEGGEALQAGSGSGKVTLTGTLKIRDVTKPVSIAADYAFSDGGLSLKGRHDFKWTDFNVPDPSIIISRLYPDMNVQFSLAMTAQ